MENQDVAIILSVIHIFPILPFVIAVLALYRARWREILAYNRLVDHIPLPRMVDSSQLSMITAVSSSLHHNIASSNIDLDSNRHNLYCDSNHKLLLLLLGDEKGEEERPESHCSHGDA